MNKPTLLLTFIYVIFIIYFAIFNWNIFILELDVNLGFQSIKMPMIGGVMIIGFFFYLIQLVISSVTSLFLNKKFAKTKKEMLKIETVQNSNLENQMEQLTKSVNDISNKIDTLNK